MARRAGRPRKDVEREPNGRARRRGAVMAPQVDLGSPELLAKRLAYTGRTDLQYDVPLAVLFAHGKLTADELTAGQRLAGLYLRVFGSPFISSEVRYQALGSGRTASGFGPSPVGVEDEREEVAAASAMANLRACLRVLDEHGVRASVIDLVVYQRGGWLMDDLLRGVWLARHDAALGNLCRGLQAVAKVRMVRMVAA